MRKNSRVKTDKMGGSNLWSSFEVKDWCLLSFVTGTLPPKQVLGRDSAAHEVAEVPINNIIVFNIFNNVANVISQLVCWYSWNILQYLSPPNLDSTVCLYYCQWMCQSTCCGPPASWCSMACIQASELTTFQSRVTSWQTQLRQQTPWHRM